MIQLNNISLQRGGKTLLDESSLTIHPGQKFALVGHNGCGKSSLFKVLLNELSIDSGDVSINPQWRVAHMAQEVSDTQRMAQEYVIDGFAQLRQLQAEIEQAQQQNNGDQLAQLHSQLEAIDGYNIEYKAQALMHGLGFTAEDYYKPVSSFSGGWRIRLNLARALLMPSDLLLLDEPTNHLDIEAISFLEQWLKQYQGTVVLVSHDRDFIDGCCSHIAHIENKNITRYTGSYSDFEEQRAQALAQQQALYEKQQQQQAHLESFIRRFKAKASKAKQAQSRVKALEKMQTVAAVRASSPYQFAIEAQEKTSSPLVNWFDVNAGYGDKSIVKSCQLSILPHMRIGLLGQNGAGKSTLIKTLAGDMLEQSGEVTLGEHTNIAYFAQHQLEALDLNASAQTHLQRLSPKATEQSIRDFLGRFKLHGDMATEAIKPFSGGEKARLALAMVAWQKPNVLLLDEPTNHLDIEMREALADALQNFAGAVVLISHDRYLLRHCVDEFWLVEDGKLAKFEGDLNDYYQHQQNKDKAEQAKPSEKVGENKKQQRQQAAEKRKQLAPLNKIIKQCEKDLDKLNAEQQAIEEQLADTAIYEEANKAKLQTLLQQQAELQKQLADVEERWMEAQEELDDIKL